VTRGDGVAADPVAERAVRLLGRLTLEQAHELCSRLGATEPS
jgi:hypothetical protein